MLVSIIAYHELSQAKIAGLDWPRQGGHILISFQACLHQLFPHLWINCSWVKLAPANMVSSRVLEIETFLCSLWVKQEYCVHT